MDFPIKEVIAGVVTLGVAGLGYRQWKRGRRSGRFIEDRETAYKEVWQALEDVHLLVRAGSFDAPAVDAAVTRANTLFIRHGLHIDDPDRALAAQYIEALRRLADGLSQVPVAPETKRDMAITGENVALSGELLAAYGDHQAARQRVMERFRRAIGAGQI